MSQKTDTAFWILREGAQEEEAIAWTDIVEMCRDGALTQRAHIYLPDENDWKLIGDTELWQFFEEMETPVQEDLPDEAENCQLLQESYEAALKAVGGSASDWKHLVEAAEIAIALDRRDLACQHFQEALKLSPYHPRVVAEARRQLTAAECNVLTHFEKSDSVWQDIGSLLDYPLARGPIYLGAAWVGLSVLFMIPFANILAIALTYFGLIHVIRTACAGLHEPPAAKTFLQHPKTLYLRPAIALVATAGFLYLPPILVVGALLLFGGGGEVQMLALVGASPILLVLMTTASLVYMPAVFIITASRAPLRRAINPFSVIRMIRKMEGEYLVTIGAIFLMMCIRFMVTAFLGFIPVLGTLLVVAVQLYAVMLAGYALGRLASRFEDDLIGDPQS
jgi:hypothetical protein